MEPRTTNPTQAGPRAPLHVNPSAMVSGGAVLYQNNSKDVGFPVENPGKKAYNWNV